MKKTQETTKMEEIVSLAKRRGFVFPSSEIYGGIANTWDYGPLGTLLKNSIKAEWHKTFIQSRSDMVGLDSAIIMNPRVWIASGHVANFNDALVDCKSCKTRFRADHLIEELVHISAEGKTPVEMTQILQENKIACPKCGGELTSVRNFNTMFRTHIGPVDDDNNIIYLRPETCQGIYVNFKNVLNTTRKKLPFGIGQVGKAFRNEITPGNFIFRTLEFEQMEIEYFVKPNEANDHFNKWVEAMHTWHLSLGLKKENLQAKEIPEDERAFYSARTIDVEYHFPFGWKELQGIANRTDYDLTQHQKASGEDLSFFDEETKEKIVPYIIEPSIGVDRLLLALMCDAYELQELPDNDKRAVLHFNPKIAPIKAAILPLMKRDGLSEKAQEITHLLQKKFFVQYDETGSIGKRYRRQDEIGTPVCFTVDYDTLQDETVTVRYRDSMQQDRIKISDLESFIHSLLND